VDQDLPGGVPEQDVRAAMQQRTPAHLAACGRRHDAVVLVNDVHELVGGIHGGTGAFRFSCARS
jgi:hypothetical protein